jgi:hypothetical protein
MWGRTTSTGTRLLDEMTQDVAFLGISPVIVNLSFTYPPPLAWSSRILTDSKNNEFVAMRD